MGREPIAMGLADGLGKKWGLTGKTIQEEKGQERKVGYAISIAQYPGTISQEKGED